MERREVVWCDERNRILVLVISRMQKETRVSVTFIAKLASDLLVFHQKPSHFFLARVAFATSLVLERAFASQKEDTNRIAVAAVGLVIAALAISFLMAIDAIGTSTSSAVFTHLHNLVVLLAGRYSAALIVTAITCLEMQSSVVVNVVLASGHGRSESMGVVKRHLIFSRK
jgi:choline-glycine betaine transporter